MQQVRRQKPPRQNSCTRRGWRLLCPWGLLLLLNCGDGLKSAPLAGLPDLIVDDVSLREALQTQHDATHLKAAPSVHPIVLVHGMAGFRPLFSWFDYFYQVRQKMTRSGYRVYALQTDPFQTMAYRGAQLAVQIDEVLQLSGAEKVDIIAHSQGGLDARYLISTLGYGDKVHQLVTVASPHHGVKIVDTALRLTPAWVSKLSHCADALANALLGGHNDIIGQLHNLAHQYVNESFNPQNRDDPRVLYYSYAGVTQANPFVNRHYVDIVNPLLLATQQLVQQSEGDNDGLVAVSSAQWGTYLGLLTADHWDEIGQLPSMPHPSFNHLRFYDALGAFLQHSEHDDPP